MRPISTARAVARSSDGRQVAYVRVLVSLGLSTMALSVGTTTVILKGCRARARKEVVLAIERDGVVVAWKLVPQEERSRYSYLYEPRRTQQRSVVAVHPSGEDLV